MTSEPQNAAASGEGDAAFARLRDWFEVLIELAPAQRDDWLGAHVADAQQREVLRRWLDVDGGSGFLDTPAVERAARLEPDALRSESLVGRRIGAFEIERELGTGGMAAVFLGRRVAADFDQRVAIKLLRRGLYSALEQRLFQRERRVLATLEHPHIARLIDGGISAAGLPYLVMEYVDGVPITQYAGERALDLAQRLRLFLRVCRAVEAAHRNLIVHRDLKPSNILVTPAGEPKLLDFGIAKLIDDDDPAGATATVGVFTPHYAAPEQVGGGAITTATDVFGLGVLLHELLVGMRPDGDSTRRPSSRAGERAADRALAPPVPPARLRRLLRGDLDNILLKALDREPARRYASAGALADDIERHLDGRPVAAHPPSGAYRLRKFVARHRAGVAVAALVLLAVGAALATALWQARIARHEALRANTVRGFLEDMFTPIDNGIVDSKQQSVHDLLANATAKLAENHELDAAERIDLQLMFSRLHEKAGEPEQAQALAAAAAQLAQAALPAQDPLALDAQISHAYALLEGNKPDQAEPLLKAIEARLGGRRLIAGMPLVRLYDGLADLADRRGEHEAALAYERRALAERVAQFGAGDRRTATGYNNLAISLDLSGHHDAAIDALRRAEAIQLATAGPDSFDRAIARINLGIAELLGGRLRAASADLAAAEPLIDAAPNDKRNRNAYYWQNRCQLALARDALHADAACGRSLHATRELLAADAGWTARALRLDASWKYERGRFDEARRALDEAAALVTPTGHGAWLGQIDYLRALLDVAQGDRGRALDGFARAVEGLGHDYPEYTRLNALSVRALLCADTAPMSGPACAADADAAARREVDARNDRGNPLLLPAQIALARIDLRAGKAAAAAARLDEAIAGAQREVEPAQLDLIEARLWLGASAALAGDCARAQAALAAARDPIERENLGSHPLLAAALAQLRATACGPKI